MALPTTQDGESASDSSRKNIPEALTVASDTEVRDPPRHQVGHAENDPDDSRPDYGDRELLAQIKTTLMITSVTVIESTYIGATTLTC